MVQALIDQVARGAGETQLRRNKVPKMESQ